MRELLLELDDVSLEYSLRKSFFRLVNNSVIKNISLRVHKGECIGIIGSNGAGKSSLLRLMAGIYSPDNGSIKNYGAKVSLLSLQAGFDPELNGWDNALLSGVMLGMGYFEAKSRLEEICDFSELGEQIYDPLKTYSTGMRARLGFSVAVAMQADLILVDEVFSVGDKRFQEKCEESVKGLVKKGVGMVIVSHSINRLESLSDTVYVMNEGKLSLKG